MPPILFSFLVPSYSLRYYLTHFRKALRNKTLSSGEENPEF